MRRLVQLDSWIISKVEPLSYKIQLWTGWSCFRQSRACYSIAGLCQLLMITATASLPLWIAIPSAAVYLLAAGLYLSIFLSNHPATQWLESQIEEGRFANYRKADERAATMRAFSTLIFGLMLPAPYISLFSRCAIVAVWLAYYLSSCDPLPPCKGKLRDLLKSPIRLIPIRTHR